MPTDLRQTDGLLGGMDVREVLYRIGCWVLWAGLWLGVCGTVDAWNPLVVDGQCRQSGNACFATIGNAGQGQGSCCDPVDSKISECVSANTCIGGKPYRWPESELPLRWFLNLNDMPGKEGFSGLSGDDVEKAAIMAWDAWTKPPCTTFRHKYLGQTKDSINTNDKKVVVVLSSTKQWAELGQDPTTLAFTRPIPDKDGKMVDGDVVVSPRSRETPWRIQPEGGLDLVKVLAHEVGHSIGLAHTHLNDALMYFANRPGKFSGLTRDDADAICFSYPKIKCSKDEECGGCRRCQGGECVTTTIAPVRNLCKPCTAPSDCGGDFDICVRFQEGNRCAQACDEKGCCPEGYRCSDVGNGQRMCIPETGKCPDVACKDDKACGPGEECKSGACRAKPVQRTASTCIGCNNSNDCGPDHGCFSFPQGIKRCAMKCVADNFCPNGFVCRQATGGRYCFPEEWLCPCDKPRDCWTGEACNGGFCRPRDCSYGCVCSQKAVCPTQHRCASTRTIDICVRECDDNVKYAAGTSGESCSSNSDCKGGTTCAEVEGKKVCLKPCNSLNDCKETGGQCYRYGNGQYCMCRNRSECKTEQRCHFRNLVERKVGACAAPTEAPPECPSGFACNELSSVSLCLPETSKAGQPCNNDRPCISGNVCARISDSDPNGVCLEVCQPNQRCLSGGVCVLSLNDSTTACGCQNKDQCQVGQTCDTLVGSAGVCRGAVAEHCGDGTCDASKGENCLTCAKDCACKAGQACLNRKCEALTDCGNKTCDTDKYENCNTCPEDCGCGAGKACQDDRCVDKQGSGTSNQPLCPAGLPILDKEGQASCPEPSPCGCQQENPTMSWLALFLLLLGFGLRRRSAFRRTHS